MASFKISKSMKFDKKTFCSAPWFQINSEELGKFNPCCVIDSSKSEFDGKKTFKWPKDKPEDFFNSNYIKYLRKNLNNGNKLPECKNCWFSEENGQKSLRQKINDDVTKNRGDHLESTWIKSFFKNKNDYNSNLILNIDTYTSGLCNFDCIMCSPGSSSKIYTKWKKNKNHHVVKNLLNQYEDDYLNKVKIYSKNNFNNYLLNNLLNLQPKKIKMAGGEPLIDPNTISTIHNLDEKIKNNVEILFVTNGSKDLKKTAESFFEFKGVFFTISLDAIGTQLEYIRKGSNWKKISSNVENYRKFFPIVPISVNCVVQALNIFYLPELIDWCEKYNLSLTLSNLEYPDFMGVKSIPIELKDLILKKLTFTDNLTPEGQLKIKYLEKILNDAVFSEKSLKRFNEYLNWSDPEQKWKKTFPEWGDFLF